jgi:arylsulfatase A-like enzyme
VRRAVALLLAHALLLATACGTREKRPGPPNVLLISIDTLRRDHLGCYGYGPKTTPNIDRLARRGVVFDGAVSGSSWTLPAHASMLTGVYPALHALQDDGVSLPAGIGTLAEALGKRGYNTLGVVAHVYVSGLFGLDRGFRRFDDADARAGREAPTATAIVDRALRLLEEDRAEPFFAFLHFFDPHWDYAPPAPYREKFADPSYRGPMDGTVKSLLPYLQGKPMPEPDLRRTIALYDGEIAYVDAEIGRLLGAMRKMGILENTLVVVTADHGEEFREHGLLGHGHSLYEELLRVPLVFSGPGAPRGERRPERVSLVDIAPTLLAVAGAEPLPHAQGIPLLGEGRPENRVLFAESIRFGFEMRAALLGSRKAIHVLQGDSMRYYDLASDPGEKSPSGADPTGGALSTALAEYAETADLGWHLKLIAMREGGLRCRGTARTEGVFVSPRRYFSGHLSPPSSVRYDAFDLSPDRRSLRFDVSLNAAISEITFAAVPPGAPIVLNVEATSRAEGAGVFLGAGERVPGGTDLTLAPGDARLAGTPGSYAKAENGCYIRSVAPPLGPGGEVKLSPETIERLRALGYVDAGQTVE